MRIKEELASLQQTDIYSLILFALYKLKDIPEYSALSELVYVLDKDSLLKLCEYFGGMTLKIPTIDNLESLVYALVLYQHINIDGKDYDEAIKLIGCSSDKLSNIKSNYKHLCEILDGYSFVSRGNIEDDI